MREKKIISLNKTNRKEHKERIACMLWGPKGILTTGRGKDCKLKLKNYCPYSHKEKVYGFRFFEFSLCLFYSEKCWEFIKPNVFCSLAFKRTTYPRIDFTSNSMGSTMFFFYPDFFKTPAWDQSNLPSVRSLFNKS